ncbi:hypothetical protein BDN67DRAFT_986135, partial [Paxillus ammoniavirescens]
MIKWPQPSTAQNHDRELATDGVNGFLALFNGIQSPWILTFCPTCRPTTQLITTKDPIMGNSISRHFIIRTLLPTDHAAGRKRKAADAPLDEPSSKRSNLQTLALLPILEVSLNAMGRKCKAADAPLDEPSSKRSDPYTLAPETLLPTPELASNTTTFPQALKCKREDHAAEMIPFKFASTTFPFPTHASSDVVIPALGTIT